MLPMYSTGAIAPALRQTYGALYHSRRAGLALVAARRKATAAATENEEVWVRVHGVEMNCFSHAAMFEYC